MSCAPAASQRPLEDFGLVGDSTSAALVDRGGELGWLCLPALGSPSLFGSLLDPQAGGWRAGPAGGTGAGRGGSGRAEGQQRYHAGTAVLDTVFAVAGGLLTVTDFMPWRVQAGMGNTGDGAGSAGAGPTQTGPTQTGDTQTGHTEAGVRFVRRVTLTGGAPAAVASACRPRPGYGGRAVLQAGHGGHSVSVSENGNSGSAGSWQLWSSRPARVRGDTVSVRATLRPGETLWLALSQDVDAELDAPLLERLLRETLSGWRGWLAGGEARRTLDSTRHRELIERAAITLKLLSAPGGAIAAAATTSLPEVVAGERNWDYRYAWLRDGSFTAQALHHLGHREEAADFLAWFRGATRRSDPADIRIAYSLDGSEVPEERTLPLSGYRDSRPVRVGNGARDQRQLDVYGEVVAAYADSVRSGGPGSAQALDERQWQEVSALADAVCGLWREPDQGIWEARQKGQYHTYSKVMCWVALDRALWLGQRGGRAVPERWSENRDELRARILKQGYNRRLGAFTQTFGGRTLDATSLLIGVRGFLPPDDPRVVGTVRAVQRRLATGALVRRYEGDDGLKGQEGSFLLCSFWLVSALALMGELDEARALLDETLSRASPLGLLAEEITPDGTALLGNFPQAYSHVGLVNALLYVQRAEGKVEERGVGSRK